MLSSDHGNYDIIGDIHGNVTKLITLLEKLNYTQSAQGFYQHPTRKIIFLGDFIDGGNQHLQVINIVKPMVENNAAYAIMGNHEFNAISFHTMHPKTGLPLRERSIKNIYQHIEFLAEYKKHDKEMLATIEWFKTLPLFLDLPNIRAIHACWSDHEINKIKQYLTPENAINTENFEDFFVKANSKNTAEFEAIEVLLKGLEILLPEGEFFLDKNGTPRKEIRVKWWLINGETYQDYALVPDKTKVSHSKLPKEPITNYLYSESNKPVFIGHYWLTNTPKIQAVNIACLDYSAGKGQKQVAYQWNKLDTCLQDCNFVSSD